MQSSSNLAKFNSGSCWDEAPSSKSNSIQIPDLRTSVQSLQLQLLGIAGVFLVILALVIPVTFVLSDIKGNTTLSYSTANAIVTTLITTSITTSTMTLSPYACGNMTFYNNTELAGTNIGSATLNYTACCSYCLMTSGCVGFTLVVSGNACYIKSAVMNSSAPGRYSASY